MRRMGRLGLWGVFFALWACQPAAPNLQHALQLYKDGKLNESRQELVLFVRARPYDSQNAIATQHILSIRQIKRLENVVVEQWRKGTVRAARRVLGQIQVLHPVYIDSSSLLQRIDLDKPPAGTAPVWQTPEAHAAALDDPAIRALLPYLLAVLDRHEEMIIHLAREWEVVKHQTGDDLVGIFAEALASPETIDRLRAVDNAYVELRQINGRTSPLIKDLSHLSEQFDRLLLSLQGNPIYSQIVFEFEFHRLKRQLLQQILAIKAQLGTGRRVAFR